jgi:hypothetical protein
MPSNGYDKMHLLWERNPPHGLIIALINGWAWAASNQPKHEAIHPEIN